MTRRPLTVVVFALLLATAAACAGAEDVADEPTSASASATSKPRPSPSPTPMATPAPQVTTPSPSPEPTLSEREIEDQTYANLHSEAGTEPRGGLASGGSDGRMMCTMLRNEFGGDPGGATGLLMNLKPPGGGELDEPAIAAFCPEFSEPLRVARTGFGEGTWLVGTDIPAGQYRTFVEPGTSGTTDCYWERTSGSGATLANDFVALAPEGVTVTISEGEGFVTRGCGGWLPLQ